MFKDFLRGTVRNTLACFMGYNLLWQLLAIASTYLLVTSGFDWWYFTATRSNALLWLGIGAAIAGFFVPIVVPVGMYYVGEWHKNKKLMQAGAALAQAEVVGLVVSCLYKVFTGRMQPEFYTHLSTADTSRDFNFGFLQHGIFWGWPSSHTAVAFAGAAALVLLYPRNTWLRCVAVLYALYIGLGVSVSIHWFSDFAAGAIVGAVAGVVVARRLSFLKAP